MDKLLKIGFKNIPVRLILVDLSHTWLQVKENNKEFMPAHDLLAQVLAASSLLMSNIKLIGSVSLQIRTNNHNLTMLLAECNSNFGVRGVVNLKDSSNLDLSNMDSAHFIVNILPKNKDLAPYQGIIPLYIGENGFDMQQAISSYMQNSEQIDTKIWLANNQEKSVGILLQKIPIEGGYNQDLEEDWSTISQLTQTIRPKEMLEWDLLTIVTQLFDEYIKQDKVLILEEHNMHFFCSCTKEKAINALRIAIKDGFDSNFFETNDNINVDCEFCNKKYSFNMQEYDRIASSETNINVSGNIH